MFKVYVYISEVLVWLLVDACGAPEEKRSALTSGFSIKDPD